jgi:hypothetical protein
MVTSLANGRQSLLAMQNVDLGLHIYTGLSYTVDPLCSSSEDMFGFHFAPNMAVLKTEGAFVLNLSLVKISQLPNDPTQTPGP